MNGRDQPDVRDSSHGTSLSPQFPLNASDSARSQPLARSTLVPVSRVARPRELDSHPVTGLLVSFLKTAAARLRVCLTLLVFDSGCLQRTSPADVSRM